MDVIITAKAPLYEVVKDIIEEFPRPISHLEICASHIKIVIPEKISDFQLGWLTEKSNFDFLINKVSMLNFDWGVEANIIRNDVGQFRLSGDLYELFSRTAYNNSAEELEDIKMAAYKVFGFSVSPGEQIYQHDRYPYVINSWIMEIGTTKQHSMTRQEAYENGFRLNPLKDC